jgi:hypothetical protein
MCFSKIQERTRLPAKERRLHPQSLSALLLPQPTERPPPPPPAWLALPPSGATPATAGRASVTASHEASQALGPIEGRVSPLQIFDWQGNVV